MITEEILVHQSVFISFTSISIGIISLLLSLYIGLHKNEKFIKFRVDANVNNANECFLTFWNSSKEALYKEDIYCLSIQSSIPLTIENCYQNDRVEVLIDSEIKQSDKARYIYPVSFDMLMPNCGAIIKINKEQLETFDSATKIPTTSMSVGLIGRLNGQGSDSVRYYKRLNTWKRKNMFYWRDKISDIVTPILQMLFYIIVAIVLINNAMKSIKNTPADMFLAVLTWVGIAVAVAILYIEKCLNVFSFSLELNDLKRMRHKFCQSGKVVEDEALVFTYNNDFVKWKIREENNHCKGKHCESGDLK